MVVTHGDEVRADGPYRDGVLRITIACTRVAAARFSLCLHVKSRHLGDAYRYPTEDDPLDNTSTSKPMMQDGKSPSVATVLGVICIANLLYVGLAPNLGVSANGPAWLTVPTIACLAALFAFLARRLVKRIPTRAMLTALVFTALSIACCAAMIYSLGQLFGP
ncbi:hypothetical protein LF1_52810 [Rubripirellula obstinata]|uniref:Uncharacterized protein n=1 Tax=Rubripirellula obstinata TaxID=406547 RepID=A0A5B1CAX2_9BACT|nr:hypothetical protein LF1_52810 [Rubripirellula obstinata]